MEKCIFCEIKNGNIPSEKLYEDEFCFVINDISHLANKHYLIIPKEHFKCLNEINEERLEIINHIFSILPKLETILGLEDGYRLIVNQRENAGQSVPHLHFHVLGGERLSDRFN